MANITVECWLAKDKDGTTEVYTSYPTKITKKEFWVGKLLSDSHIYDEFNLNWEDDNPKHIEIKITELPQ